MDRRQFLRLAALASLGAVATPADLLAPAIEEECFTCPMAGSAPPEAATNQPGGGQGDRLEARP